MLEKIISGGQTGADRAALDAAIANEMDHGGWVPKGRLAEDGVIPSDYNLREMPTDSYSLRTEKNVADSDGTVIFSHGPLSGGSALTCELAEKHGRPSLHIDLKRLPAFKAAVDLSAWINGQGIRTLNVAGPRASNDPAIYSKVRDIMGAVIQLCLAADAGSPSAGRRPENLPEMPQSVAAARDLLILQMPLKDKATIANMTMAELAGLDAVLGPYIRGHFALPDGNPALRAACRAYSQKNGLGSDDPVFIVIAALWQELRRTHKLRAV